MSATSLSGRAVELATADRTVGVREAASELLSARRADQSARVISVVTIATVALVGTLIMGEIWNATEPLVNGTALETEAISLVEGFGSAMSFVPIVLIVLLAALVIAVVSRMG